MRIWKHNRLEVRDFLAAVETVKFYIDVDLTDRKMAPGYLPHREPGEPFTPAYGVRTLFIAQSLFLLRNCSGFEDLCNRLRKSGDFRATFFELHAAMACFAGG